jgi:hypothetical protein
LPVIFCPCRALSGNAGLLLLPDLNTAFFNMDLVVCQPEQVLYNQESSLCLPSRVQIPIRESGPAAETATNTGPPPVFITFLIAGRIVTTRPAFDLFL